MRPRSIDKKCFLSIVIYVDLKPSGKSGYVLMENGTRVPQFVVGNLRNGRYKLVANRTNLVRSGSGTIHHELRLPAVSEIVWPGGSRVIPKSVPECGFYGELCRGEDHQGPDASGKQGYRRSGYMCAIELERVPLWQNKVRVQKLRKTKNHFLTTNPIG